MDFRSLRMMVVEDQTVQRKIAVRMLHNLGVQEVAEAEDGFQALTMLAARDVGPDVVLSDLRMPGMDGIEAIAAIRARRPQARIIVLTTYRGDVQVVRALSAGASGYLLKSLLRRELLDTIRDVHGGARRVPPEIAAGIAEHLSDESLSARELDVLQSVAAGNANKLVAADLGISEETVKAHMKNILAKLGARDRTHAVTIAIKRGIIEL
jgi:two-component system NarL family response regulator